MNDTPRYRVRIEGAEAAGFADRGDLVEWLRMQMRATIFGATMGTLMATVAVGEDVGVGSANQHLPGCRAYLAYSTLRDPTSFYKAGYCVGMVGGIALSLSSNSMAIAASRQPSSPYLKCADIPDSTEEQWVRVVVAYMEARPQRMHSSC